MTLEDFFTLTEMSNGLVVPARVQELVSVMQKEKECEANNSTEITRQYSAVASTIAATEDKECLELFIQLDGLPFLDNWLNDVQKLSNETSDNFSEETIVNLLRAVEKLHVDKEKLVSSGILVTLKNLLDHKSSKIQEMSRALFDSWEKEKDEDEVPVDDKKVEAPIDGGEIMHSGSGEEKSTVGDTEATDRNLQHIMWKDGSPRSPPSAKSASEDKEKYPSYRAEGSTTAIDRCSNRGSDEQKDVQVSESINSLNHIQEVLSPEKLESAVPKPSDDKTLFSGSDAREMSDDVSAHDLQSQNDVEDADDKKKISVDDDENISDTRILEHPIGSSAALVKVDAIGGDEKHVSSISENDPENDPENATVFEVPQRVSTICRSLENKCDMDFEYGMIDPLEVARQVAIEVEMEVEESCSSSEKTRESKVHEPDSPDSRSANGPVLDEASPTHAGAGPINGADKLESSQITDAALDLESNDQKWPCDFDLNLEVCSDDIERPGNPISTSISIVSASRASAAPGAAPVPPLQFEGTLGWKGSAATSAFRPASPRKIPESDNAISSGGSDSISKQKQSFLDIDLNVAEGGDDRLADLITGKHVSLSSALPSGESSVEASPKRFARLELDLNCASEEGEAPTNCHAERRLFPERGDWSNSPSSSSSSKQQLSLRNFDLNDQPMFHHDSSGLPFFKKPAHYPNTGDSVVSIMGMKVEVNHKDPVPRPVMFPNGRVVENAVDLSVARSGFLGMGSPLSYAHSPAMPFPMYGPGGPIPYMVDSRGTPGGPIPYMVDSRGAPVGPQIFGSASALPPSFSHQPFIMSMTGAPFSNGVVPSRSSLELNSGLIFEGGARDHGGTRQFFNQGPIRSMNDHFRTDLGPSTSSSIGGKRKEPDDSWELFPLKRHPPPWK